MFMVKKQLKMIHDDLHQSLIRSTCNVAGASRSNSSQAAQQQLMQQCKMVADNMIPRLVQGIKGTMHHPESVQAHMGLIQVGLNLLKC